MIEEEEEKTEMKFIDFTGGNNTSAPSSVITETSIVVGSESATNLRE